MTFALDELGYDDVYHMKKVPAKDHADFWVAAMEAKFEGKGPEYGREEWDHLLGDCMAVTDIPAAIFPAELVAAYPDAKVILTTRSVDSCICPVGRPVAEAACAFDGRMGALRAMTDKYHEHLWWNDFPRYGKRAFKEHNDLVRRVVPPERLLEYEVRQGWEPLCAFLGKDVPTGKEFPRVNDTQTFQQKSTHFIKKRYMAVLSNAAKTALPVLMVGAAMWWRFGGKTGLSRG
ncbi:hypothetical protein MMC24_006997 [Lignoscripta atroalba]|nr:hypothetical protein [Lignoscripta atroalba]